MAVNDDKYKELKELFCAGLAGDASCYNRFLRLVSPIIRRALWKKLSPTDAEDVLQEILISIHKAKHTYDGLRPIMPWVMAIASFRTTDHLRKLYAGSRHETMNIDDFAEILADDAQNVTDEHSQNESINGMLDIVQEREKNILTMLHIEGYTAKETGKRLGMKESAVKVAAHRAIKKIRDKFGT